MKLLNKKSERNMLALFLGLLFILGNIFGFDFINRQRQSLELELDKLKAQKSYNDARISQKDLWEKRKAWLAQNQPEIQDLTQGNILLLESLQKLAKDNNLTIVNQTLLDPRKTPDFQEVSAQLVIVGSLESITRWLVAIQQPTLFQAITHFNLKTDTDPTKIRCDLKVVRWYQSTQ